MPRSELGYLAGGFMSFDAAEPVLFVMPLCQNPSNKAYLEAEVEKMAAWNASQVPLPVPIEEGAARLSA